jgi:valyl-tRNA synthetase
MKLTEYKPQELEEPLYRQWEAAGYFEIDGNKAIQKGKNFCVMLPPPNVTGSLHIGHALNHTLSDIIVRYKRMDGYKTLWQPGTDHAGIATQNVVEKQLLAQGIKKEELGREKFIEKVWEWKEQSGGTIVSQMRRMGVSPAWSRERFTMDEGLKKSVKKAFLELYDKGFIVRGNYMVNWCTHDGALSDIEVDYHDADSALYHIKYFLEGSDEFVVVATTRPETYFGDTAVMVNPNDERYTHLLGKTVVLPIIGNKIKIIADEHVDVEFGTGVVKVTPAHDTNDYEVGKRHGLEFVTIFDEKGLLNNLCGEFAGLERLKARKIIVDKLQELGHIEKIEPHKHQVGHCYRCGNVVEPYISKQWFVTKETALEAIKKADLGETKFVPKQWKNNFDAWMRELRDWCISRQLWWGHQIPVMHCEDCGLSWGGEEGDDEVCPKCSSRAIYQDQDVLDTWFSSALWPFSTLGWANENNAKVGADDMTEFYPNSLLITGFDILFFWVARMMMMGETLTGKLPFDDVFLHALVRDEHGHKMSKSKGNVIDPITVVEKYGADSIRFALSMMTVPGRDIRLSEDKFTQASAFANKLYNASKYLLIHAETFEDFDAAKLQTPLGKFMASKMARCEKELREELDSYRFSEAVMNVYRYLWDDFCDWGIELSKADKTAVNELGSIFKESLKLLHPFMPFITEHLWLTLSNDGQKSIMISEFPKNLPLFEAEENAFELIKEAVISIRRAKTNAGSANKKTELAFILPNDGVTITDDAVKYITLLSKCAEVKVASEKPQDAAVDISQSLHSFSPMGDDEKNALKDRLTKQAEKLEKELAKLEGMLKNEKFVANAPKELVEQNQVAANELKARIDATNKEMNALG